MAIRNYAEGGEVSRRVGLKTAAKAAGHPAKKHAAKKHAAKKHAAKKHAAKKHAEKYAEKHAARQGSEVKEKDSDHLGKAFHHLQRASAVISLLEPDSGGDLRKLLDHAVRVYRMASSDNAKKSAASAAWGLARASEHLALAGLYLARREHRVEVNPAGSKATLKRAAKVRDRVEKLKMPKGDNSRWLFNLVEGLLAQANESTSDPHLAFEVTLAADGISEALYEGM